MRQTKKNGEPEKFDVKNAVYVPSSSQAVTVHEPENTYDAAVNKLYNMGISYMYEPHNWYIPSDKKLRTYLECNTDRQIVFIDRIAAYARKIYEYQKEKAPSDN